jgi:hypothetical protein
VQDILSAVGMAKGQNLELGAAACFPFRRQPLELMHSESKSTRKQHTHIQAHNDAETFRQQQSQGRPGNK